MDNFETKNIKLYVANILKNKSSQTLTVITILNWMNVNTSLLGINIPKLFNEVGIDLEKCRTKNSINKNSITKIIRLFNKVDLNKEKTDDVILKNSILFSKGMSLSSTETDILNFFLIINLNVEFKTLIRDLMSVQKYNNEQLIADFLLKDVTSIRNIMKTGILVNSSIICKNNSSTRDDLRYYIHYRVSVALSDAADNFDDIVSSILGMPLTTSLKWNDYNFIKNEKDVTVKILKQALKGKMKGINILFYGPPGTGKTELSKLITQKMGKKIFAVGEKNHWGEEMDRSERLEELVLLQNLIKGRNDSILLFDEMEDTIGFGNGRTPKVFLNRLLEDNEVPTIWTANNIHYFDPAMLRRMTYAIEIKLPDSNQRKQVLKKMVNEKGIDLDEHDLVEISGQSSFPVSILSNAVEITSAFGGDKTELKEITNSIRKVTNHGLLKPERKTNKNDFNIKLVNDNGALDELYSKISPSMPYKDFTLCLYGPPGTGKSEYVRAIAKKMKMDVIEKRASDILSKWIGETEQNIAKAFDEALCANAFLIFDEVDSLLSERNSAKQSWEVSQVNEMLTWLEGHPLPVAVTTNLMDKIDQAALRRFTFKVKLDFLNPEQAELAWKFFFNRKSPGYFIPTLTTGDFVNVVKRLRFEGDDIKSDKIYDLLENEVRLKKEKQYEVGFQKPAPQKSMALKTVINKS